jgi:hypothetical protein
MNGVEKQVQGYRKEGRKVNEKPVHNSPLHPSIVNSEG